METYTKLQVLHLIGWMHEYGMGDLARPIDLLNQYDKEVEAILKGTNNHDRINLLDEIATYGESIL